MVTGRGQGGRAGDLAGPRAFEARQVVSAVMSSSVTSSAMMNRSRCSKEGLARLGLGVEKEVVFEAEDVRVGLDAALGVEEESVEAFAGLQLLHVIRGHGVEQAGAVFAGNADAAAGREVDDARAGA